MMTENILEISCRPAIFNVKPPRFAISQIFRSSAKVSLSGSGVFMSSSKNWQYQPVLNTKCI